MFLCLGVWGSSTSAGDGDNETWLLVLIGCSVGVLLLGAVLALFLLRCKEYVALINKFFFEQF